MTKPKRKLTLAHAVIIALITCLVFSTLQGLGLMSLSHFGYNLCSWIGLMVLSITIACLFNTQPGVIQFFIFVFLAVFFLVLYTLMAQINPKGIPYINALGMGICSSLFVCVIYAVLNPSKSNKQVKSDLKTPEPQRLIQDIYKGLYSTREDLYRYYINYTSKKDTFVDLLITICNVCDESSTNDDLKVQVREMCKNVFSIVNPILEEERKMLYLSKLNGKEHSSLVNLHKNISQLEDLNKEIAINHISYIAETIVSLQQKLKEENKRNSQSLTISIVGVLLTVIFSLLSFLTADKYSALHAYIEYLK